MSLILTIQHTHRSWYIAAPRVPSAAELLSRAIMAEALRAWRSKL